MANKRATTYLLSINDDWATAVKKINSALKNLNQDLTITNITHSGSGGTNWHNDLDGRLGIENCHDISSIQGLVSQLKSIDNSLDTLSEAIDQLIEQAEKIEDEITEVNKTLTDHEERITALEEG